jgi:hypothetical protein
MNKLVMSSSSVEERMAVVGELDSRRDWVPSKAVVNIGK